MINYESILAGLQTTGNLRQLPEIRHSGRFVERNGQQMINLSSNDYLGLAARQDLMQEFLDTIDLTSMPFTSSSSRLLTGNFSIYTELEQDMALRFGREAVLLFNSGYHANTGILPALAGKNTLILADKLVHASIIDGMKLSSATYRRYRHNDYADLRRLVIANIDKFDDIFIVTESLFSMDGDVADLRELVAIKHQYPGKIKLYVDEAHAIGVRGNTGLGVAEEMDCIADIDLLVGTFGKAMASMGAYLVCDSVVREYLVNTMRPLIFSTALPPFQIAWTKFIFDRLPDFDAERRQLQRNSDRLRSALVGKGGEISQSHIIPYIVGENSDTILTAEMLQRKGFYCLPVRPPTVPEHTSRIRFSITAAVVDEEISKLVNTITNENQTIQK
jgi:8-amino-7-oxononanoate synthase